MVDVLGDYCIVADNLHGSAQAVANVKYQFRRVTSMIDNEEDSSSYYTGTSVFMLLTTFTQRSNGY